MGNVLPVRKEVTILEDDRDIREICEYLFQSEGYKVNSYGNIADFRNSKASPDLYLFDVMLPDGNGVDICNELKAVSATAQVPIIIMSAHLDRPMVAQACGADEFLSKPFSLQRLVDTSAELIRNYRLLL